MRRVLRTTGWLLVAGEYPGGSDHELYPLNVVDPTVARDRSPDPRRHSLGELIPDIVALKGRHLLIGEAKPRYNEGDRLKLLKLIGERRADLLSALNTFANIRGYPQLLPVSTLIIYPTLVFPSGSASPSPNGDFSYLRIESRAAGHFEGALSSAAIHA